MDYQPWLIVTKFVAGVPRCRDMRVRDVRQTAAEHGAGPREDRPPPHRQNRSASDPSDNLQFLL